MGRTLLLCRHGKSDYPGGVTDHDRPLAGRGTREASLAGEWISANAPTVDAVLCSTATRTRQTLARTGINAPVSYLDELYDATAAVVIGAINGVADDVATLLVIGHEPTMSSLALGLAGPGSDGVSVEAIAAKYPTSAIAVLTVAEPWNRLTEGGASLIDFHVPR